MGVALVTGVNGQDGSYLAAKLQELDWDVVGIGRQPAPSPQVAPCLARYLPFDVSNAAALSATLYAVRPDMVFHAAAVHGSSGLVYESNWREVHEVNTIATHACLEFCRTDRDCAFFLFSSAKVFELRGRISEASPRRGECIYSITKEAATALVHYYRKMRAVRGSVLWFFNHDSKRRSDTYFLPTLCKMLRGIVDSKEFTPVNSVDFWCDWGHAQEYMELLARHAGKLAGHDFIFATGETVLARDVASDLFSRFGVDPAKYFPASGGPASRVPPWHADVGRLRTAIGTSPTRRATDICLEILGAPHA